MTRQQQKQLKELQSCLAQTLKNTPKQYGFKKKDYMIWTQKNGVFFDLHISILECDGHCYCDATARIKPLWVDDLFWDIMDMPENKAEPLSLRAVGAFAVFGAKVYERRTELTQWDTVELQECVFEYLKQFKDTVDTYTEDDYRDAIDPLGYHGEIREVLALIHGQRYNEATERAKDIGDFINKGITFGEYAVRYCKTHAQ